MAKNRNITNPNPTTDITSDAGKSPAYWKPSPLTALPLPFFIGMVAIFNMLLPPTPQLAPSLHYDPPYVNGVLFTVFLFATSLSVAYVSLKSYLQTGMKFLVLLGSAGLVWGTTQMVAGWSLNLSIGPNAAITISNTGALIAGILHLAGSAGTAGKTGQNRPSLEKPILAICYGGVITITTILSITAVEGLTPTFFVPGVGQTLLRMIVLSSGAAAFAISALIFARLYYSSASHSRILYWYFLALALTGTGLAAVFFGRAPGDPISWTGRTAMFLGGIYFLKAVRSSYNSTVQ